MQEPPSPDFLQEKYHLNPKGESKGLRIFSRFFFAFCIGIAVFGLFTSFHRAKTTAQSPESNDSFSFFGMIGGLIGAGNNDVLGENEDRINILLLGVGGTGHDGPQLADTIIFGSLQPSTGKIGMMSIPRDTLVNIPGYGYRKVNHVNAYGELEGENIGIEWSKNIIGEMVGEEIHYAVRVDFAGFEQIINDIGGITIDVDNAFTDYNYPTEDDLVQTISFEAGIQEMDGETALQYARSRHGTNGEGSDFARSERQQKMLLAVKDELLSTSTLLNPNKLKNVIDSLTQYIDTDIGFSEMTSLAKYGLDINAENIKNVVLDSGVDSPLYATNVNGAYVLIPKKEDWSDIHKIADEIFIEEALYASGEQYQEELSSSAKIEIQNGTSVAGLAFDTSQILTSSGFDVIKIGNAQESGYSETIIYDLTSGQKSEELAFLKQILEADISMSANGWIYADEVIPKELSIETPGIEYLTTDEPLDFLIILGQNASNLVIR